MEAAKKVGSADSRRRQVSGPTVLSWIGSASLLPIALAVGSHLLAGWVLSAASSAPPSVA